MFASQRKIIHCDCDCFFAAIEIRDDPGLKGLPVAVGGSADRRGVIATCNYEARKYGIHSAMASATAKRLCRELIIIPGNMEKYRKASQQMHVIFQDYTKIIEPLSLDEAFLDVTASDKCFGSGTFIAEAIRKRVRNDIGITISAGIAPNKFLAKIASDWNKPDGQFVISPENITSFIFSLPVKKIPGVGKVTAEKMASLDIETCGDLQRFSKTELIEIFGSFGDKLFSLCRGADDRPVKTSRRRKSISVEHTYSEDLPDLENCLAKIPDLLARLYKRLPNAEKQPAISKQFVKIKFNDFISTTVEQNVTQLDPGVFQKLCEAGYQRGKKPVRLLGIGIRVKDAPRFHQLELYLKP